MEPQRNLVVTSIETQLRSSVKILPLNLCGKMIKNVMQSNDHIEVWNRQVTLTGALLPQQGNSLPPSLIPRPSKIGGGEGLVHTVCACALKWKLLCNDKNDAYKWAK